MTIQEIIDGIAEALFQEFKSGYEIYTEKVEQGLEEPCFLIRCVNPTKNVHLGVRYKRTNQFIIQYIPSTSDAYEECTAVLERLFECLEDVVVSQTIIHGTELQGEIIDGILNFNVNYDGFVMKESTLESIDGFELSTSVKG